MTGMNGRDLAQQLTQLYPDLKINMHFKETGRVRRHFFLIWVFEAENQNGYFLNPFDISIVIIKFLAKLTYMLTYIHENDHLL